MKILIVDDVPDHLTMLEAMLSRDGYSTVVQARSGLEAVRYLGLDGADGATPTDPVAIDLVLMDIRMAEMDGIEACRRIKSSEPYRDVPVIMVTAQADAGFLKEAFDAGAMDFISKPIDRTE